LDKVFSDLDIDPQSVLYAGYNPTAEMMAQDRSVSILDPYDVDIVDKIKMDDGNRRYDCVMALDEYFTFARTEEEQRSKLEQLAARCDGWLITTLMDYKNLAPYKKNQVELMHDYKSDSILLEHNVPDDADKQSWRSWFYGITDHSQMSVVGPMQRRTMYFKQLARYSQDAGSKDYIIQKNNLYRGFGRKHWEHIITIRF
jgi:hypothetical protein